MWCLLANVRCLPSLYTFGRAERRARWSAMPPDLAAEPTWFYRDAQGHEQGPFDSLCMRSWCEQGYFAADQLIWNCPAGAESAPSHQSTPLQQLWRRPEEAFVVAAASGTAAAACVEIGPPPKRQRMNGPAPSPGVAPFLNFRTASLHELYEDRLAARDAPVGGTSPAPETFRHVERGGAALNLLEGLALHRDVLTRGEQMHLVEFAQRLKALGAAGELTGRTFAAPPKWRRGNGRVTVQFGCCYNYAGVFSQGQWEPAGILPAQRVCALPPLLLDVVARLEARGVVAAADRPDSCIVNLYERGDCIPPHIDHHDFTRPFATLSLLSEQARAASAQRHTHRMHRPCTARAAPVQRPCSAHAAPLGHASRPS